MVWAHGYRGEIVELTVDNPLFRDWFLGKWICMGSTSSYSENAYNVAQAAKDIHLLTNFFNGLIGKPNYTFIYGASMGGHIAAAFSFGPMAQKLRWGNADVWCNGAYEIFDFFLDFNLVSQALAGLIDKQPIHTR